ncbi:MAG TPA: nitronate monooxygenase family protein [Candidatus Binataceae bacterium]|nr:nitronate monooxygenase family protein [Candidatus Binataceae bacterium]
MFHTALCDLLGIRYPILQGAMQGAGGPRLVAAVAEAGGLGVLPTFGGTEAALRADIERTRELTSRPFGANITPIGRAFTESRAAVCIEMGVPIVTTGRGDPGLKVVERLRNAGILVLPVVPSVRHALRVEAEGAAAIIASGSEAGGHVGTVATLPLVAQVADAVRVPVVAAGGIGDARGFLAMLALGACGIQLGTLLIATPESEASSHAKQRIIESVETGTLITSLLTGKPVRTLATAALRDYEGARLAGAPAERQAELRERFRIESQAPGGEHAYAAGQIAGMIREIRPVAEIFDQIITDAAAILGRLSAAAAL